LEQVKQRQLFYNALKCQSKLNLSLFAKFPFQHSHKEKKKRKKKGQCNYIQTE